MVAPLPGREGDVDDERLSWWTGPGSLTNVVPGSVGRETCHTWVPLSFGAGERKNLQPMAFWLGWSGQDLLWHVIAGPAWDDALLWFVLVQQVDRLLSSSHASMSERMHDQNNR